MQHSDFSHLKAPDAVLFDWDNTLVDSWPVIHQALFETFTAFGMEPWSLDEVKTRVAHSMRDAFPGLFGSEWEVAALCYQSAYKRMHLEWVKPFYGMEGVLQWLKQQHIPTAIVSNKRGATLRQEITHLGLDAYIATAVGAGDAARDKPHADPILMALDALKETKPLAHSWFVGDTMVDIEAAFHAQCQAIWYGDPHMLVRIDNQLYCERWPVAHVVRDHTELLALLNQVHIAPALSGSTTL